MLPVNLESYKKAKRQAAKAKRALRFYLPGTRQVCDCKRCWPKQKKQSVRTIEKHQTTYGIHSNAPGALPLPSTSNLPSAATTDDPEDIQQDLFMQSYRSDSRTSLMSPYSPKNAQPARSGLPSSSILMSVSCDNASLGPHLISGSGSLPGSGSRSTFQPTTPPLPQCPQYMGMSSTGEGFPYNPPPSPDPYLPPTSTEEEAIYLCVLNASTDVNFFGRNLADLSISGASKASKRHLGTGNQNGDSDSLDNNDKGPGGGEDDPDDPNDQDGAQPDGAPIQVPPDEPGGAPGDPGQDPDGDGARLDIPALGEDPTLRNIYLHTWAQYAFNGVTQETIQAILESHKSTLLAGAHLYNDEFLDQVRKMPTTLRSLEQRLGMDFSELVTIYPVCPECGKRYTMEELYALRGPQCQWHVRDQCTGILYTESTLADGTRKRTPARSFPYNSLIAALGRLLSRIGIAHYIQHWRRNPGDAPLEDPPEPRNPQAWYNRMRPDTCFGDISQASDWHAQATGLARGFDSEAYVDQPIGARPISLARSPIGLNLGVGADGYRVFKGKFAASSYSANGGYAFDQMLEPLVDDLIWLAGGVELPVYDHQTGEIRQQLVYANLSVLIVDWISRIKCTGHAGVRSEHNHCPYCKTRQCLLATPQGYQTEDYELRDPHEHLQDKHRWLRAPEGEREDIRLETGTTFTEFDRIPGFFAFDNAPIDAMHLLDLGVTHFIAQTIIFQNGMLRKRIRGQDYEDSPEGRFNAFLARTIFPYQYSRLPAKADTMDGRTKAEQWRLLCVVMPVAYFEAWRVGDVIPDNNIPPGGQNTRDFKAQEKNAELLCDRLRRVHIMDEGDPDDEPQVEDCFPSRNPREYYGNILRYCLGSTLLSQHRVTLAEISQGETFLKQVGVTFAEMNVHLTPSFHAATHLPDHIRKYGNIYNTSTARFERANKLLANVKINGHGNGVLEATMAKGFLRRTECYRYVTALQSLQAPTPDDIKTTEVLLGAMRNGPEHEVQHGMLEAVIAGEALMHRQEEICLATTSAQVNFWDEDHHNFYQLMVNFCNNHRPEALEDVHIRPSGSTRAYPHFRHYGIRYGSVNHHRGFNSRYGFIHNQIPVLIQGIYETTVMVCGEEHKFLAVMIQRFVVPNEELAFPWNHWNDILGIDAWEYNRLSPLEAVPPTAFTGVFALSDLTMPNGQFWITIAMINTRPKDLVENEEPDLEDDG